MDGGRRGIAWNIPVRLENDEFVGLCGQDKNRMHDTLESLSKASEEATHHKVTAQYFLTSEEQQLFLDEGWSLEWPAVLFSIDAQENAFGFAKTATRRRRSASNTIEAYRFPCLIFTGMNFDQLMTEDENNRLEELRSFVAEVPEVYVENVPLTYGANLEGDDMRTDQSTQMEE